MLKQSRGPKGFLIKRSSKVQDYKGEALPGTHPSCFLLSQVHVVSVPPIVAIFKQVMFCFVF